MDFAKDYIYLLVSIFCILMIFAAVIFWEKLYRLMRGSWKVLNYVYLFSIAGIFIFTIYTENRDYIVSIIVNVFDILLVISSLIFLLGGFLGSYSIIYACAPKAKNELMIGKRENAIFGLGIIFGICNLFISGMVIESHIFSRYRNFIDRFSRDMGFSDGLVLNLWLILTCWTLLPLFVRYVRNFVRSRS